MAFEAAGPKSKILRNLEQFDWSRVELADRRDPRTTKAPCWGDHVLAGMGRGEASGVNGHSMWLTCKKCRWGATGSYQSAGPLAPDVATAAAELKDDYDPKTLHTKAIGLDAAEKSTLDRLEKIREQKATQKGKPKSENTGKGSHKGAT